MSLALSGCGDVPPHGAIVAQLGEGACWDALAQQLYCVDITGRRIWRQDPQGDLAAMDTGFQPSFCAPTADGAALVVSDRGLWRLSPAMDALVPLLRFRLPAGLRTNDAHLDSSGRLWWSTMDETGRRRGALFLTQAHGGTRRVLAGLGVPNSLAFDAARSRLYVADSAEGWIRAYDVVGGRLGRADLFCASGDLCGAPDGSALDVEGCLWSTRFGGGQVVRLGPDGSILERRALPVSNPTSCAFGGADGRTLYVTTAKIGLDADHLLREPLAGRLFALAAPAPGVRAKPFSGRGLWRSAALAAQLSLAL